MVQNLIWSEIVILVLIEGKLMIEVMWTYDRLLELQVLLEFGKFRV